MKKVLIFTSNTCPRCPEAKDLGARLEQRGVLVTAHDVGTAEGLAEAAFYHVLATPAILIIQQETVIAAWRGIVPDEDEVLHGLG
jgi:glutaredoxin